MKLKDIITVFALIKLIGWFWVILEFMKEAAETNQLTIKAGRSPSTNQTFLFIPFFENGWNEEKLIVAGRAAKEEAINEPIKRN